MKVLKVNLLTLAFAAAIAGLGLSSCGSKQVTETGVATEEISVANLEEVSDLRQELLSVQSTLNGYIAEIDLEMAEAEDDLREKLQDSKSKLTVEADKLTEQISMLENASAENWDELKSKAQQLARNIENSIKALEL